MMTVVSSGRALTRLSLNPGAPALIAARGPHLVDNRNLLALEAH